MKNIMFYVTLNYPNKNEFFDILDVLKECNYKYIEIGIPVENPFMDGPIIQQTHKSVLENKLTRKNIIDTLEKIRTDYDFKVIIMTYFEGIKIFQLDNLKDGLYEGILCVDKFLTKKDVKIPVQLYPPKIGDKERADKLKHNEVFAYVISGEGKTGSFQQVSSEYISNMDYIKKKTKLPVFVGFGISTNEDVDLVLKSGADGAIIGTAFLRQYINEGIDGLYRYLKTFE